ncbi:DJ-1/PfpI family protein [Chitinophaga sp. Mgbs1]|uniref:DJ-1/PfpI family protein n=1 Tax=Chitinophaga solisilvae TaxID=1233460 RepID=A0A3S1CYA5_9BACT|nr:DJ-1/PfpI family protein [Chitinophaga solisilvae]
MKKIMLLLLLCLPFTGFTQPGTQQYVCPPCGPCDNKLFDKPGKCPDCGMDLIQFNPETMKQQPLTIAFYLQDGVEVLDFAGPMEVFSYAGFKVFTVSRHKAPLKSQGILTIVPDYSIEDAPPADIFAVFGGNSSSTSVDQAVISWIKARDKDTRHYFSVCTGAFILASAGLLDNLTVTTFHSSIGYLRKKVPSAKVLDNARYVDNGRIITTAGISAGIDGALHVVSRLRGEAVAKEIAKEMEYDKYVPEQGVTATQK